MAEALNSDTAAAEAVKRSGDIPPAAAAAIREAATFLHRAEKHTGLSPLAGRHRCSARPVLLTGGGSRTPGLGAILAENFSAPVERMDLLAEGGFQIDGP